MADDYSALYDAAGKQWNVDPLLLQSLAQEESGENPGAVGPMTKYGNARGAFQFIPQTAAHYGITDPHDITQAAYGAAHYLSDLMAQNNGDVGQALVGYGGYTGQNPAQVPYIQKIDRKSVV